MNQCPKKEEGHRIFLETTFKKQCPNFKISPPEIIFDKTDHWQL